MIHIIYETHGTTLDNEAGLASGNYDVELSELGKKQAREMGQRYKDEVFDAIFTSDLKRAYHTAEIAFGGRDIPIIKDAQLRECNYGDLTRHPNAEVEPLKIKHIEIPFPNGESYEQTVARVKSFLLSLNPPPLARGGVGGEVEPISKILIIDHRATWYTLEHLVNGRSLKELISSSWQWQPGWRYKFNLHEKD